MKTLLKVIFSLCMGLHIVKANPKSLPLTSNATIPKDYKISVIDVQLEEAKSFGDIRKVVLLINEFIMPKGDSCEVPIASDFKTLCLDVSSRAKTSEKDSKFCEYSYELRIWRLACVNIGIDSEEAIKTKVQKWWNKYKTSCKCDSVAFGLQNGNFLKFALSQNMPEVIETEHRAMMGTLTLLIQQMV